LALSPFFFQAEDGIRDFHVTGVQTCALPICFFTVPASAEGPFEHPELEQAAKTWDPDSRWEVGLGGTVWDGMAYDPKLDLLYVRSEERRVGKERRARGRAEQVEGTGAGDRTV